MVIAALFYNASPLSLSMNKVIGFHITAQNESLLQEFYSKAFGWQGSPGPPDHVTDFETGNPTLEGSLIGRGDHIPDYVGLLIESTNLEETIKRALEQEATLIRPPFQLDQGDRLAILEDPEGHLLTLLDRSGRNR